MSLLIFFVYPNPKGSEENQFTPLGDGVNKLIFKRLAVGCINLLLPFGQSLIKNTKYWRNSV
jgi:hypothetical protein